MTVNLPWQQKSTFTFTEQMHFIHYSRISISRTIFYKFKLPEVQINLHFGLFGLVKKSQTQNYGWKSNRNVFLIQIDASIFAEFEISEFEISRFDCIYLLFHININILYNSKQAGAKILVPVCLSLALHLFE